MQPFLVPIATPAAQTHLCISHGKEHLAIQKLIAQPCMEAFSKTILRAPLYGLCGSQVKLKQSLGALAAFKLIFCDSLPETTCI